MPVGSTVYIDNQGTTATVGQGAEIFNDYRTRGNNNTNGNVASGAYSHAEGNSTTASGAYSHAKGYKTKAIGYYSHAEGYYTEASGQSSHAGGVNTKATQYVQTAIGKYNSPQTNTLFEVGNGSSDSARSNAFEVYSNGDVNVNGDIKKNGSPYITIEEKTFTYTPTQAGSDYVGLVTNIDVSKSGYKPIGIVGISDGYGNGMSPITVRKFDISGNTALVIYVFHGFTPVSPITGHIKVLYVKN